MRHVEMGSCFDGCSSSSHLEVVRLLLEAEADKNVATQDGESAIAAACLRPLGATVAPLPGAVSTSTAEQGGHPEVEDLLAHRQHDCPNQNLWKTIQRRNEYALYAKHPNFCSILNGYAYVMSGYKLKTMSLSSRWKGGTF